HTQADSGDGFDHRQWAASLCAGQPHFGRLRAAGRDAVLEIHVEPLSDARRKYFTRRKTFGISHWLPGIFTGNPGDAPTGRKLRRLCLRQSNARANSLAWVHDWRGELPDEVFSR